MPEYVTLGCTGLKVSRIAFGCGFRGVTEVRDAEKTVQAALDRGINFFDCANKYRLRSDFPSELVLGKALRGHRENVVITSKFGAPDTVSAGNSINCSGGSRYHVIRAVERSLKQLGTDYIDVYLMHRPDSETAFEETMSAFDQLRRDGKILYAGLCNHSAWQLSAMQGIAKRYGSTPISVIQNAYNLLNRSPEEELLPAAAYEGVGVMAYSPLAAGLLTGVLTKGCKIPEKSTWGHNKMYKKYLKYVLSNQVTEVAQAVDEIAEGYGVAPATVAVAWVLKNRSITSAIAGADSVEELDGVLAACDIKLRSEDAERLDRLSHGLREDFRLPVVQQKLDYICDKGE